MNSYDDTVAALDGLIEALETKPSRRYHNNRNGSYELHEPPVNSLIRERAVRYTEVSKYLDVSGLGKSNPFVLGRFNDVVGYCRVAGIEYKHVSTVESRADWARVAREYRDAVVKAKTAGALGRDTGGPADNAAAAHMLRELGFDPATSGRSSSPTGVTQAPSAFGNPRGPRRAFDDVFDAEAAARDGLAKPTAVFPVVQAEEPTKPKGKKGMKLIPRLVLATVVSALWIAAYPYLMHKILPDFKHELGYGTGLLATTASWFWGVMSNTKP